MNELIELVFECAPMKKICNFTDFLLRDGKVNLVKYVDILGEETIKNSISADDIGAMEVLKIHHILIKTSSLIIGKFKIYNADIWIEFYPGDNNHVDFLINFEIPDLVDFMTYDIPNIMFYAHNLSEQISIENYYCGLEPAMDDETRFFTKTEIGPLKVNEVCRKLGSENPGPGRGV